MEKFLISFNHQRRISIFVHILFAVIFLSIFRSILTCSASDSGTKIGTNNQTPPTTTIPATRDDPRWMPRHEQNVEAAQKGGVDIAFFGDSITENMNKDLMHQIIGKGAQNFGIGGDHTQHLLWRLQNGELDFRVQEPKVAVILIGTNDLYSNGDHDIFLGIKANVDELRRKLPQTKILILGILPRAQSAQDPLRARIKSINTDTKSLADNKWIWYADIGESMLEPDGSLSKDVMHDYLHPNSDVGYKRMFNAIKPHIDAALAAPEHMEPGRKAKP